MPGSMVGNRGAVLLGSRRAGPYVRDSFSRGDSATSLGNAETRQAWTVGNNGDAATLPTAGISSNQGYFAAVGTQSDQHAWVESGVSDGVIDCTVAVSSVAAGSTCGVLFRRVDGSNYFAVRLDNSADTIGILRNLATTRSVPSSTALTLADGQAVALRIVLLGSSILVYADGVLKLTYTDANLQTATKHGLYGSGNSSAAAIVRFDNFNVQAGL